MSDAMTNREIEDVLTSIRRLVAQEGTRSADTGRLILTEAQRIVSEAAPPSAQPEPVAGTAENVAPGPEADDAFVPPLELTDPVMTDEDEEDDAGDDAAARDDHGLPAPDFGQLEATIAELEAAVSASGGQDPSAPHADGIAEDGDDQAEPAATAAPAGAEAGPDTGDGSNVTALYGRLSFQHRRSATGSRGDEETPDEVQSPETSAPAGDPSTDTAAASGPARAAGIAVDPGRYDLEDALDQPVERPAEAAVESAAASTAQAASADASDETPDESDDASDETVIDEAMLRVLVAQIVREELHGQLGERITLQVRKLVRAEIAKALDDRSYL